MFGNEEFASNSRSEGVAISSIISSGVEEDTKSDVSCVEILCMVCCLINPPMTALKFEFGI